MKNSVRMAFLFCGDIIMLSAAFMAMLEIAFPGKTSVEAFDTHFIPFLYVFLIWLLVLFLFSLYDPTSFKPTIPHLRRIGIACGVAFTASIALFYVMPEFGITPKTNLVIFTVLFIFLFLLWRRIFYAVFAGNFKKSVAVVAGAGADQVRAAEIIDYIANYPQSGFYLAGVFSSLQEFIERSPERNNTLIVANKALEGGNLQEAYRKTGDIIGLSYAYEDMLGKVPVDTIDQAWFLHNIRDPYKNIYEQTVRVTSVLLAMLALIILSPIAALTALLIKLGDGGPIFYVQPRVGRNGEIFKLFKFRSMVPEADKNGAEWTEKNDSRITAVGKIIRRLHVDEIPQLWNIIRGDMTLVGPRPELPSFVKKLEREIPHYGLRHIILPGFTGWAQIKFRNARGVAESKEKFEYDLFYIKNRNIFMDLGIMLRTITIIFTHD